jgi:hypothetical protein
MSIRRGRYHFSVIIFSIIFGLMGGAGIVLITSIVLILQGGMDLVLQFWEVNGKGFEDTIKWSVLLIGIPLGGTCGVWLWCWLIQKTGLLNPHELEEMLGSNKK